MRGVFSDGVFKRKEKEKKGISCFEVIELKRIFEKTTKKT